MLSRDRQSELRGRIFRHLDGIVTAPTANVLDERGVLARLVETGSADLASLCDEFGANEGYLNVALRVLASQGWLEQRIESGCRVEFQITAKGRFALEHLAPYAEVMDFIRYSGGFHRRKFQLEPFLRMESIERRLRERFDLPAADGERGAVLDQILGHVEGALFGPTIVRLGMSGMFHKYFMEASFRPEEFHEDGESFGRLLSMFADLGWFVERKGTYRFTDEGLFYARRASAYGVTVSYLPTFRRLDELIFGHPDALRVAPGEPEKHVDRETNVWGSGGAHSAYFRTVDEVVVELFNQPIEQQPKGVLDMGCGNGAFLEHLYEVIENRTLRGQMLDDHPLFLVGVDFNEVALKVTRSNLTQADIWAKVVWGDIGRPDRLARDLREDYGIELRDLLNVRTFLDHNRPWRAPESPVADRRSASTGAFASRGARVTNEDAEDSLREHLERWAPYLDRFGLIVIELHTLPPALAAANLGRTPVTAYDATHGYTDQYILEIDVFERVAAEAGLVPTETFARRFPKSELATVSVNLLRAQKR